jgi:hypothetical protein
MTGHAGLETGKFNMLTFKENQLLSIFKQLGIVIDKDDGVLTRNGEHLHCTQCGKVLSKKNIHAILPGSKLMMCDDLACISEYISEHITTVC